MNSPKMTDKEIIEELCDAVTQCCEDVTDSNIELLLATLSKVDKMDLSNKKKNEALKDFEQMENKDV